MHQVWPIPHKNITSGVARHRLEFCYCTAVIACALEAPCQRGRIPPFPADPYYFGVVLGRGAK